MPRDDSAIIDTFADTILVLGVLALGAGTAFHLSLMWVQGTVVTTTTTSIKMQAGNLYPVLTTLQWAANTSLTTGAVGLLGGGVLASRDQLRARYESFTDTV